VSLVLVPLASDSFQRANVDPLTTPWALDTYGDPGFEIVSDLCNPTTGATCAQFYTYTMPNDQYASIKVFGGLQSEWQMGVGIRMTDSGVTVFDLPGYTLWVEGSYTSGEINAITVFAAGSEILFLLGTGITLASGDVFTLAVQGTTVSVLHNGVVLSSVTNTTYSSGSALMLSYNTGPGDLTVSNFTLGSIGYSVSGNCGIGGATVAYTGTASGSVTADGSGNFSIGVANGTYTLTPSLLNHSFSPTSQNVTVSGSNVTGVNFIDGVQYAPGTQPAQMFSSPNTNGKYVVLDNGAPSASVTANTPKIQSVQFDNAAATSCAFTSNNTKGNFLVAAFQGNVGGSSVVTDSNKNNWILASSQITTAGTSYTQIWFAANCSAGANTVATTNSESLLVIAEYSGVQGVPLAQTGTGSGSSENYSVPVTIQAPYALLIGVVANDTGSVTDTVSGSFTDEANAGGVVFLADQIVSLPGTYTYGGTLSSSSQFAACVAVFLPQQSNSWTGDRFSANSGAIASNGSTNTYSNESVPDFLASGKSLTASTGAVIRYKNPS
jgi:hypothetical protein